MDSDVLSPIHIITNLLGNLSLQTLGDMRMESPHHSLFIQRLTPHEKSSTNHPIIIEASSEQLDEEIIVEGPTLIVLLALT